MEEVIRKIKELDSALMSAVSLLMTLPEDYRKQNPERAPVLSLETFVQRFCKAVRWYDSQGQYTFKIPEVCESDFLNLLIFGALRWKIWSMRINEPTTTFDLGRIEFQVDDNTREAKQIYLDLLRLDFEMIREWYSVGAVVRADILPGRDRFQELLGKDEFKIFAVGKVPDAELRVYGSHQLIYIYRRGAGDQKEYLMVDSEEWVPHKHPPKPEETIALTCYFLKKAGRANSTRFSPRSH